MSSPPPSSPDPIKLKFYPPALPKRSLQICVDELLEAYNAYFVTGLECRIMAVMGACACGVGF